MTTNFQHAYDIIAKGIAAEDHPGEIMQQLHTAGIIAPDLPEPTSTKKDTQIWELGTQGWQFGSYFDDVTSFKDTVMIGMNNTTCVPLDLDEAETLALALLAAAKHQKEGSQNES